LPHLLGFGRGLLGFGLGLLGFGLGLHCKKLFWQVMFVLNEVQTNYHSVQEITKVQTPLHDNSR